MGFSSALSSLFVVLLFSTAFLLRVFLLHGYPEFIALLESRGEVNGATNSFNRLEEGMFLFRNGFFPYEGQVYHQPPLLIPVLSFVSSFSPAFAISSCFILLDMLTALLLMLLAQHHGITVSTNLTATDDGLLQRKRKQTVAAISGSNVTGLDEKLIAVQAEIGVIGSLQPFIPLITAAFCLFNPFSLFACLAKNVMVVTHFFSLASLVLATKRMYTSSAFLLSVATYIDGYPFLLAICIILVIIANENGTPHRLDSNMPAGGFNLRTKRLIAGFLAMYVFLFCLWWCLSVAIVAPLLCPGSFGGEGSVQPPGAEECSFVTILSSILSNTYGTSVFFTETQPSIGLWWYFFVQVFPRFFSFFLVLFNLFTVWFPPVVAVCLGSDYAIYSAYVVYTLTAVFKPFPVIGDFAISYALLIAVSPLLVSHMEFMYLLLVLLTASIALGGMSWYIWTLTQNGNFYYVETLIFNLTNLFIVLQSLLAVRRRSAKCGM